MTDEHRVGVEPYCHPCASEARRARPVHDWLRLLPAGMIPAVLALTLGLCVTAAADIEADPPQPAFTAADLAAIARNASLKEAAARDPWVVYRVLRAIDVGASPAGSPREGTSPAPDSKPPADGFDSTRDPDLGSLQRVAPEAAHDLFMLIKKATKKN